MKDVLYTLVHVMKAKGLIEKKTILQQLKGNKEAEAALNLAFNPFMITGIAKKKLSKRLDPVKPVQESGRKSLLGNINKDTPRVQDIELNFNSLIDYFAMYHTGTDDDIRNVQTFIRNCILYYSLDVEETIALEDIITKTITLGIAVKSINEVFDNIIPTFDCMLGTKLQDCEKDLIGKEVTVTEKLDGNRCICVVNTIINGQDNSIDQNINFYSRNGKEIEGLDSVRQCMKVLPDGVYDGELLGRDFNDTQSTLRTKGTKEDVVYNIFDYIDSVSDFFSKEKQVGKPYVARRADLNSIFEKYGIDRYVGSYVKIVPVLETLIYDKDRIMEHHDFIKSRGGEGVMLNVDSAYYTKDRTKDLVKVKAMKTCDIRCIGIENGTGRLENTLGFIICEYKGYEVRVGSGFDDASRDYYYNNQDKIINHLVEVQYFEETTNDNGTVSLRFPVFLQVRNDKDEESYN